MAAGVDEDARGLAARAVLGGVPHDEDVLEAHVPVHDPRAVQRSEGFEDAAHDGPRLVEVHRPDAADARPEGLALEEAGRDPGAAVLEHAHRFDRREAGRAHAPEGTRHREVTPNRRAVAGEGRTRHLDRHPAGRAVSALAMLCEVDNTHVAFAELLEDAVARDLCARRELGQIGGLDHRPEALIGALVREQDRLGERLEGVLVGTVLDERAGESALAAGPPDLLGVVAEQLGAERHHVLELEEALELPAQEVFGRAHRRNSGEASWRTRPPTDVGQARGTRPEIRWARDVTRRGQVRQVDAPGSAPGVRPSAGARASGPMPARQSAEYAHSSVRLRGTDGRAS